MTVTPIHSSLLNHAAKEVLRPLGLTQRGRSRRWIDDHGWWLINVEFQPSNWSRGSYLNVGVQWLWRRFPGFAYQLGGRVFWENGQFVEFHSVEQFTPEAQFLANLAADKVVEYRAKLSDPAGLPTVLRNEGNRHAYHIAVVCGLLGRQMEAQSLFEAALIQDPDWDWQRTLNEQIADLRTLVANRSRFRSHVGQIVLEQREILKLNLVPAVELPGSDVTTI